MVGLSVGALVGASVVASVGALVGAFVDASEGALVGTSVVLGASVELGTAGTPSWQQRRAEQRVALLPASV